MNTINQHINADLQPALADLYAKYSSRALSVHAGRNRVVFVLPHGYVVKLPRNTAGSADNLHEANTSRFERCFAGKHGSEVTVAKCRAVCYNGFYVGLMEYVKHINIFRTEEITVPLWAFRLDCAQAGLNKAGKLVAYDYGLN